MRKSIALFLPLLALPVVFAQPGINAQLIGVYNVQIGSNNLVISRGYVGLPFMTTNGTITVETKHGNFNIVFHGRMTVTQNGTNETVVEFIHENKVTYISMVVYENMTGITEKFIEHYVNTFGVNLTQNITMRPVDNDTFELETKENATAMLFGFIPVPVTIGEQMYVNATNGDIEQTVDIRPWWWFLVFGYKVQS